MYFIFYNHEHFYNVIVQLHFKNLYAVIQLKS